MERPASIVNFERFYLARIIIGVIATALTWNTVMAAAGANPAATQLGPNFVPTMMIGFTLIGVAISLILWYFAARKAAVVAKWIIVVFFAIGLVFKLIALATGKFPMDLTGALSAVDIVLGGVAVYFLFQPDARIWFGETKAV